MGCLIMSFIFLITYLIAAAIVKIAATIFGFAFSWGIVLGVTIILILLKLLFD